MIRRPRSWLNTQAGARVIVHTKWGKSFDGTLTNLASDGIVLAAATVLDDRVPVAGDVFIPRSQVAFVQVGASSS